MFSFLVADMISDKLQETFPTQRWAAPWPLNCIEKREFCVRLGKVTLFKHGIAIRCTFTLKYRKTNFLTNLKLR